MDDKLQQHTRKAKELVDTMLNSIPSEEVEKIRPDVKRSFEQMIGQELVTYEKNEFNKKFFGEERVNIEIHPLYGISVPSSLRLNFQSIDEFNRNTNNSRYEPYRLDVCVRTDDVYLSMEINTHFSITNPDPNVLEFVKMANKPSIIRIKNLNCTIKNIDDAKKFMIACFWRFMATHSSFYDKVHFSTSVSQNATFAEAYIETIGNHNIHFTLEELNNLKLVNE